MLLVECGPLGGIQVLTNASSGRGAPLQLGDHGYRRTPERCPERGGNCRGPFQVAFERGPPSVQGGKALAGFIHDLVESSGHLVLRRVFGYFFFGLYSVDTSAAI